ncbi:vacuolar amino acid transporter 1 [[Candida] railenensis]|uniref:Vacuolar amino acid transporter 1 n=1 Tax=[Candida] railenensis TaxID=45579 RepID=A0A9P0W1C0_9ASCO|nr:vacuolar amino acid transporter 1 [[Candida] railenensis]
MSEDEQTPLRRPSHAFLDQPIGSFKGPNSIHNFATSFTRAQAFNASMLDPDIHRKRSFFVSPGQRATEHSFLDFEDDDDAEGDEVLFDPDLMIPSQRGQRLSTVIHDVQSHRNQSFMNDNLHQHFSPNAEVFYTEDYPSISHSRHNSTVARDPYRDSYTLPAGSQGAFSIPIGGKKIIPSKSFASIRSAISNFTTASQFNLKQIEDKDGHVITVLSGQSTAPQTVFNSINVLIGVGLLVLPVGIMKAGWLLGVPFLLGSGLATLWTARLLSKAMDTDATIMTYADLGHAAYGSAAKLAISLLFSIDLLGAGVSLNVLMSDSLYALLGANLGWTKVQFKVLCFFILTPFSFIPLPILSIFSLFGIMATVSITLLVFIVGIIKQDSPGSLIDFMPTNLYPQSFPDLLLSIGIFLSPFGGHAIFPNLKSDMRHPYKFSKTLFPTYFISILVDMSMGVLGFLMFGALCENEVTNSILFTPGYPSWCYPLISGLICIVPLAKTPLNAKPIISSLDTLLGIDARNGVNSSHSYFKKSFFSFSRFLVRVFVNAVFVILAILFPELEKVIGMLGASICFIVCIIFPCLFYLKLCKENVSAFERFIIRLTIFVSAVLAVSATYATIMF